MSRSESALARFVPRLAAAREAGLQLEVGGLFGLFDRDLLADEGAWTPLAAVRVHARVQARGVREVREAIPMRLAEPSRGVPEAVFGREGRTLVPHGAGEIGRCGGCTFHPGHVPCNACGATGHGEIPMPTGHTIREVCRACQGRTTVVCARCEGHGRVWIGPALEVTDRHGVLRHVYAPDEVSLALQEALAAVIDADDMPPALAISLEPRVVDPYRGTLAGHAIAGHGYDDVVPTVRTVLHGLAGELEVVRSEVALHAWPFLFARGGGVEAAIVVDHVGVTRLITTG